MTLHHRRVWVPLIMVAVALGATSCNQPESGTRNIVDIVSLNGNVPLLSDVYNFGDNVLDPIDDFIPIDVVEVTFRSRAHDGLQTTGPGKPFGSVRFLSYNLVWRTDNPGGLDLDGDGTVDVPNQIDTPMNVVIPTGQASQTFITVVSGGAKTIPPISCLGPVSDPDCANGIYNPPCGSCLQVPEVEFNAAATITFFAQEETSGETFTIVRGLNVFIGQFSDD